MDGKKRALIIANSKYEDTNLQNLRSPAEDAGKLASVLGDPDIGGFEVIQLLDNPDHLLRLEIFNFFHSASLDDLLLLHISSHGIKNDEGELFFAAFDTKLDAFEATALPSQFVNQQMGRSSSRRIVMLLDCCYSGAFSAGSGLPRAGGSIDLKERFEGRGRAVLTASTSMEYSFEGTNLTDDNHKPSVFTQALVQGLATGEADLDGDSLISVKELYDYVSNLLRERKAKQTPQAWFFELQGPLILAKSRKRTPARPEELMSAVARELDVSGVRDLSGRGALESRLEILHGRLSYMDAVIHATVSMNPPSGEDRTGQGGLRTIKGNYFLVQSLESRLARLRSELHSMGHELHILDDAIPDADVETAYLARLWDRLYDLENIFEHELDLCFTIVQGTQLRDSGLDCGFNNMADELLSELSSVTSRIRPSNVLIARAYSSHSEAGILTTSFPDYGVWSLPLIAHELGHFALEDLGDRRHTSDFGRWARQLELDDKYIDELFCDAFATFVMGPSYPCSYVLLRAHPRYELPVPSLLRLDICRCVLMFFKDEEQQSQGELLPISLNFIERSLYDLNKVSAFQHQKQIQQEVASEVASNFIEVLRTEFPMVASVSTPNQQARISLLARQLAREKTFEVARDTTVRDILNAGWLVRLRDSGNPGELLRKAIQDLVDLRMRETVPRR